MYLKSLSMRGFKSFADKTTIELDPLGGITAIVGPNGCGKSNLVDAVRWVLGEQNPKELRSSVLEEVIFAGSAARKPLSLAEVTLTLDNSDNKIKSEFSEISIRRRTFRSGESEFQLNKTDCRLKDIRDLFLDTGLGNGSYSIISQGQVDEILSSKPEDRRRVFEEAARINKYKFRKKAAERKLISTEQNLLRISDLKGEITNQISTLSVQAEKAKQFNELKNSLKNLEIGISKRQLNNFTDRKQTIDARIAELKDLSSRHFDSSKQLEDQKNSNKNKLAGIERETEDLRLQIGQIKLTYEENKSVVLLNKEKERHLVEQLESIRNEFETMRPRLEELRSALKEKKKEEAEYGSQLSSAENELKGIEIKLQEINAAQSKGLEELDKIKSDIFDHENALMDNRNRLVELESSIKFVKDESKRDNELLTKFDEEIKTASVEKDGIIAAIASLQKKIDDNRKAIGDVSAAVKNDRDELASIDAQFLKKKESLDAKSSKYDLLLEFQKTNEDYPKGVKEALRLGGRKEYGELYGTVSEHIKVDPEHETAVSVALASSMLDVLVDNDATAHSIIKYLKDNDLGRATFITMDRIDEAKEEARLPREKGVLNFASDIVKADKKFSKVIKYLLGKTLVVDNLKNAVELSGKGLPFRIVTLGGEYIPQQGMISGGGHQAAGSLIGREREILTLEEEIKNLKAQVETMIKTKEKLIPAVSARENELKGLSEIDSKLGLDMARSQHELASINEKIGSVDEEAKMIRDSIKARTSEAQEIESRKLKVASSMSDNEAAAKELNASLKSAQEKVRASELEEKKISAGLTESKIQYSRVQTSFKHISAETERIDSEIKNLENMIRSKNESELNKKIDEARETIIKLEKSLPKLQEQEKGSSEQLEKLHIEKGNTQKEIENLEEKLKLESGREYGLRDDLSKEEVALAKIDGEIASIEQRMTEEYGLTLEQITASESDVTNVTQTKEEINTLKQKIGELGPVNLLAIDEYDKARERISFIESQYGDLMIARENLNNLIKELDSKAKIEFLNTIKIVNEHFSNIFASLFEGGEAKITLSGDENILEGGIEIVAKPGGKKWLSLSVMSGGERSLTAIALLFALMRTHPSPFCFLDEVDAALDEANVHRFTKMLKDFSKTTQIILITHNKQTMSISDSLYGITMAEPGISSIVSVKLSKVAA